MKYISVVVVGVILFTGIVSAQFKSQIENQHSVSQSLVHPSSSINSFLGLLNPDNFMMRHSFDLHFLCISVSPKPSLVVPNYESPTLG